MAEPKKRKAKSPYQKYGKTPFRYSEAYGRWKAAVMKGDNHGADEARRAHRRLLHSLFGRGEEFREAA